MARKTKSGFNMQGIIFSAGGGMASAVITEVMHDNIKMFQDKPNLLPFVPAIMGSALAYFGDDNLKPAGYGMIGYAGAQLGEGIMSKMDGFSRMNIEETEPGLNDSDFSRIEEELELRDSVSDVDFEEFTEENPDDYSGESEYS